MKALDIDNWVFQSGVGLCHAENLSGLYSYLRAFSFAFHTALYCPPRGNDLIEVKLYSTSLDLFVKCLDLYKENLTPVNLDEDLLDFNFLNKEKWLELKVDKCVYQALVIPGVYYTQDFTKYLTESYLGLVSGPYVLPNGKKLLIMQSLKDCEVQSRLDIYKEALQAEQKELVSVTKTGVVHRVKSWTYNLLGIRQE